MRNNYIEMMEKRRSIYALGNTIEHTEKALQETIMAAVKHSPSAFNSQTSRVVILFNEHHPKLWDIVEEKLRAIVPAEHFTSTEEKLASFRAGFASILFFEDQNIVKQLQDQFSLYAEQFPTWSEQATGIAQHSVWTALAQEGIGASLQHYNPLIDQAVRDEWQLPDAWKLTAQMPFGSIEVAPGEKEFMADEDRFKVFH
ncbi:nitroreductase family protein [Sporosarcina limicola]|uniref:Oxidoreductase (Fatty acid repression mutant protein) n=1 Tax=Sporosarcina limicola TaxID=34101 RepID=A0A927REK2_9BACL|nr:nitroreductase family protein [Sporosarcina limicola]MBE1556410.1 putative oxidoreductase (fatty acid repression mutant protein) [Sporosarcina limicola]